LRHGEGLSKRLAGKNPATYLHGHGKCHSRLEKSHGRKKASWVRVEVDGACA